MKHRNPRARPASAATATRSDTLHKLGQEIADLRARLADLAADRARNPVRKNAKKT